MKNIKKLGALLCSACLVVSGTSNTDNGRFHEGCNTGG